MLTRTLTLLMTGAILASGAYAATPPTHQAASKGTECKAPHNGTLTAAERKALDECRAKEGTAQRK